VVPAAVPPLGFHSGNDATSFRLSRGVNLWLQPATLLLLANGRTTAAGTTAATDAAAAAAAVIAAAAERCRQ